jgi:hypothetical protein
LQGNGLSKRQFRQNQAQECAAFSLKNLKILHFSQPTIDHNAEKPNFAPGSS